MGSIRFEAAVLQLEALGCLKLSKDGAAICLTDKGIERARQILSDLPEDAQILVAMLGGDMYSVCAAGGAEYDGGG